MKSLLLIPLLILPALSNINTDAANIYLRGQPANLTINAHAEDNCGHMLVSIFAEYGAANPVQAASYHLSRDLADNEKLSFYNALPQGGPIDMGLQGNMLTCAAFIATASGYATKAGCHSFNDVGGPGPVGCFLLTDPSSD